jgi:hypothetical protein
MALEAAFRMAQPMPPPRRGLENDSGLIGSIGRHRVRPRDHTSSCRVLLLLIGVCIRLSNFAAPA